MPTPESRPPDLLDLVAAAIRRDWGRVRGVEREGERVVLVERRSGKRFEVIVREVER